MISFIIPAKNEVKYIEGCLESIALQETKLDYEVLVVDSKSTDYTAQVVKQKYPHVKIIRAEKFGVVSARQAGFLNAKGNLLVFLDADVRLPDKFWLGKLMQIINQPKVVAISTHYKYYEIKFYLKVIQMFGTYFFIYPWIFLADKVFKKTSHMVGGMMAIKKSALEKMGGFSDDTQFYGDEISLVKKLYPLGKIVVSPRLWVYTSGRRYQQFGMFNTVFKYVLNYFWMLFLREPYHK